MKISNRLKKIASLVENNDKVVDVGCDHGLTSIYIHNNISPKSIIASDISSNALNQAVTNIEKYKLTDKIETRVSNGLDSIKANEFNTVIISGLGGNIITDILLKDLIKLQSIDKLILCPNNHADKVRKNLTKLGFMIVNEELLEENNKYYELIVFKKGQFNYSDKELKYGPFILLNKTKTSKNFYKKELEKKKRLLKIVPKKNVFKRLGIRKEIRNIKKYFRL